MPQVPTVDAPTVPQSGAPLGISAPSEAFAGNVIGEGLKGLGGAVQADSDMLEKHAEQFQAINNKSEADAGFVQHLDGLNTINANYQANNRGMAAFQNLPAVIGQINQQRDNISNTMSNPMAKAMFDADSRRAAANVTGELSRFAASQRQQYVLKQALAVQESLNSDSALHPENFDGNMKQMAAQQAFINQQLGLSPEDGALEMRKTYAASVQEIVKIRAGNGDVAGAAQFLDQHKEGMDGKIYADTVMQLKPALLANDAATAAQGAVQDSLHGMGSQLGPTVDYLTNVHGREGTAQNPHSTADGIGQFTNETWIETLKKDPQFKDVIAGKSNAELLAMRHDPGVANRAILSYAQSNATELGSKGLPVNAATVGLAHGFGPGGAEHILNAINANPNQPIDQVVGHQVALNNKVSGQTVSQVFGAFQSRFGGQSVDSTAGGAPTSYGLQSRMQTVIALADQQAEALHPGNESFREQVEGHAITLLNRQIVAAKDTESNAYTTLGSFAMANQVQDLPTLLKSVPNGLQMYNSLPLSQRTSLQADIHRNAVELTPERFQTRLMLDGAYSVRGTNPQAFLNLDVRSMPLTLADKLKYSKMQDELRNKPASTVDPNQKIITQLQHSEQYLALVGKSGLNIPVDSAAEHHLLGTFSGQLDAWREGHPNQSPGPKDISAMLAASAAQNSTHQYFLGMKVPGTGEVKPSYDISDEDRQGAIAYLTAHNEPTTEYDIARTVGKAKAKQGIK